ncbi:unnamed protein product [Durusdinium trenchii]|uniref:Polyamine aminopropyltransferase (Putrescine aminopropyltransferase) (PAPT) (Spermidine synthase) (SPDS) (SPDSY) n=2 Tax=Durusdinium trenchii TaxID=1381693 RepID=A0ABP0HMP8_9DINO
MMWRTCWALLSGLIGGFILGYLPHYLESRQRFVEPSGVGADLVFRVQRIFSLQSKFQKIDVLRSDFFGHILTIDDDLMLTERDEFIYHEMIAHVPAAYVPNARDALIIGGGDGGTAKQLLRRPSLVNLTVVELDEEVVHVCRRFFPRLASSFDDPRVTLLFADGASWVSSAESRTFDLIIVDSTDFGAAQPLFEERFHRHLRRILAPGGMLVINLTSLPWQLTSVQRSVARQRQIFRHVRVFQIYQPSYTSGHYCFAICSNDLDAQDLGAIDWAAATRGLEMQYYSREVHQGAFALPEFAKKALGRREQRRREEL